MALALWTNHARAKAEISFELTPNCLLTRWPVLFLTGPRSFFYFKKFWNFYPSFLAEHGYEIFHIRLPWSNRDLRLSRFQEFLKSQAQHQRHFHLVMDSSTLAEFADYLRTHKPEGLESVSEVADPESADILNGLTPFPVPFERIEMAKAPARRSLLQISYDLHRLLVRNLKTAELSTLGAVPETALPNSKLLLERLHRLAEMDYRS